MKFGPDIIGAPTMNSNNFVDPLTLPLAPPAGHNVKLSNSLVYDRIPAKMMFKTLSFVFVSFLYKYEVKFPLH